MNKTYYCFNCGWNCSPQFWETKIGKRWVCQCGMGGLVKDTDAPILISKDNQGINESDYDFIHRVLKEPNS